MIRKVRDRHGINRSSSVNLMACDGNNLVATRFIYDYGRFDHNALQGSIDFTTQWYTVGRGYGFHDSEWKMTGGAANAALLWERPRGFLPSEDQGYANLSAHGQPARSATAARAHEN